MATLHAIAEPMLDLKRSQKTPMIPVTRIKEPREIIPPAFRTRTVGSELVRVLERAAGDDAFIARLTCEGSKALQGYNLTSEEQAALLSGDLQWIEAHLGGKLDDRLSTWLWCRLQQEIW